MPAGSDRPVEPGCCFCAEASGATLAVAPHLPPGNQLTFYIAEDFNPFTGVCIGQAKHPGPCVAALDDPEGGLDGYDDDADYEDAAARIQPKEGSETELC